MQCYKGIGKKEERKPERLTLYAHVTMVYIPIQKQIGNAVSIYKQEKHIV